jgi:hypothetical protein
MLPRITDMPTADAGFRARHATSFDRVAVVSDEDWARGGLALQDEAVAGTEHPHLDPWCVRPRELLELDRRPDRVA